jgi:hypothetical protein
MSRINSGTICKVLGSNFKDFGSNFKDYVIIIAKDETNENVYIAMDGAGSLFSIDNSALQPTLHHNIEHHLNAIRIILINDDVYQKNQYKMEDL